MKNLTGIENCKDCKWLDTCGSESAECELFENEVEEIEIHIESRRQEFNEDYAEYIKDRTENVDEKLELKRDIDGIQIFKI